MPNAKRYGISDPVTKSIKGVEIFAAGTWNGDLYTVEDLDDMVHAFAETQAKIKPHLKLGHDPDQKILQNDGLPAAGWVGKVYREGTKLLADFIDLPEKVFKALDLKAYRKVSSEIYWDIKIGEKVYKRMLSAVALLGADLPAVHSLDDILALYGLKDYGAIKAYADSEKSNIVKVYHFGSEDDPEPTAKPKTKEPEPMPNADEAKKYQDKIAKLEAENAKLKADGEKAKEYKDKQAADLQAANEVIAKNELNGQVAALEKDQLVSPAMRPFVRALLGEEKKVYTFSAKDKDGAETEKKYSKSELIGQMLKLHSAASDVNLEEGSEEGKRGTETEDAIIARIEKYAADHKVEYGDAHKAVMAERAGE